MHRLICAFVVRIWHKQVFSWRGSYIVWANSEGSDVAHILCERTAKGLTWLIYCASEQRRVWQDCADALVRLSLGCSPMWSVPVSRGLTHLCLVDSSFQNWVGGRVHLSIKGCLIHFTLQKFMNSIQKKNVDLDQMLQSATSELVSRHQFIKK